MIGRNLNAFIDTGTEDERLGAKPITSKLPISATGALATPGLLQPVTTDPTPATTPPTITQPGGAPLATPAGLARAFPSSILTFPGPLFLQKTATQLARGAITQLNESNRNVLNEAITTITNQRITASGLMNRLEHKTKIGEVLNKLAKSWEDETKQDFAEELNMEGDKFNVMDDIVAIAILNDPDLEDEIRIENTSEATGEDILENRTISWQYPAPGTPLDPPYLILVAVESEDVAQAEEVIESIFGQLDIYQGFKIPKEAAQKLR